MKARKQLEELEANTTLRSLSDIESDDTDIEPDDSSCEPDELSYSDSSCDRHSHSVEVLPQINKNVKRKKMSQTETNEKTAATAAATDKFIAKRVRSAKKCPVAKCHALVVALPRHLRTCHNWSHSKSIAAVGKFALRKSYALKDQHKTKVDSHRHRHCPVDGCYAVVKRLPPHIRKHHAVTDETIVKELLKKARRSKGDCGEFVDHEDSEEAITGGADNPEDDDCNMTKASEREDAAVDSFKDSDSWAEDELEQKSTDSDNVQIFDNFERWCQSADGGLKSEKSAKQHKFQAQTINSVIGKTSRPLDIFCKKSLQEKFLNSFVNETMQQNASIILSQALRDVLAQHCEVSSMSTGNFDNCKEYKPQLPVWL